MCEHRSCRIGLLLLLIDLHGKVNMELKRKKNNLNLNSGFLLIESVFFPFPCSKPLQQQPATFCSSEKAAADSQLTRSLFDVAQNAEQGRLHPVAVQCVLPAREDKQDQ